MRPSGRLLDNFGLDVGVVSTTHRPAVNFTAKAFNFDIAVASAKNNAFPRFIKLRMIAKPGKRNGNGLAFLDGVGHISLCSVRFDTPDLKESVRS